MTYVMTQHTNFRSKGLNIKTISYVKGGDIMKSEVVEKLGALIIAAFGLVAALAWNDTIKAVFKALFGTSESIGAMLTYAVIVTVIAVIAAIQTGKAAEKVK